MHETSPAIETDAVAETEVVEQLRQAADDIGLEVVLAGVSCFASLRKDQDV